MAHKTIPEYKEYPNISGTLSNDRLFDIGEMICPICGEHTIIIENIGISNFETESYVNIMHGSAPNKHTEICYNENRELTPLILSCTNNCFTEMKMVAKNTTVKLNSIDHYIDNQLHNTQKV